MEFGHYSMEPISKLPAKGRGKRNYGQSYQMIQKFIEAGIKVAEIKAASQPSARLSNLRRIIKEHDLGKAVHVATRQDDNGETRVYLVRGSQKRGHTRDK